MRLFMPIPSFPSEISLHGSDSSFLTGDALSRGWGFISADYRLLIPSTGHEILRDVKSLFAFLGDQDGGLNKELRALGCPHQIDPNRLFVGGSSAGAYPAFLAALFAQPKPKGFFSLYGVGGDLLSEFYVPLLRTKRQAAEGQEVDAEIEASSETAPAPVEEIVEQMPELKKFLTPTPDDVKLMRSVADVPFSLAPRVIASGFRPTSSPSSPSSRSASPSTTITTDLIPGTNIPGHRVRISGALRGALHHAGVYLDYLMGMPGLTAKLGEIPEHEDRCAYVAACDKCRYLFPQIWIDKDFPPSIFIHGDTDVVVSIEESKRVVEMLQKVGVDCVFIVAEGKGHQLEERASPEVYVQYIKPVVEFLKQLP